MVNFLYLLYRRVFSPALHTLMGNVIGPACGCRFLPTCSEYAREAFHEHPAPAAVWLVLKRIFRCQPSFSGGWDPVPGRTPRSFERK